MYADDGIFGYEPIPSTVSLSDLSHTVAMDPSHYMCLYHHYQQFYEGIWPHGDTLTMRLTMVLNRIKKFSSVTIFGQLCKSKESGKTKRGRHIQAYFRSSGGNFELCPGEVQYYFCHIIRQPVDGEVQNDDFEHVFAFVRWFEPAHFPRNSFKVLGFSVWKKQFQPLDHHIYPADPSHLLAGGDPQLVG